MLAAADCAEKKCDPPPELEMAWDAERFSIPPYKGARADQPAGLLKKMRIVLNIYNAMSTAREYSKGGKMKDFIDHPSYKTYQEIMKLRKEQHG